MFVIIASPGDRLPIIVHAKESLPIASGNAPPLRPPAESRRRLASRPPSQAPRRQPFPSSPSRAAAHAGAAPGLGRFHQGPEPLSPLRRLWLSSVAIRRGRRERLQHHPPSSGSEFIGRKDFRLLLPVLEHATEEAL